MLQMQNTGVCLESLGFTPLSSMNTSLASAEEEMQLPSSTTSLWPTRTWLFLFFTSVIWFCSADSRQPLRKQTYGTPLAAGTFCKCVLGRMERWRPRGAQGPSWRVSASPWLKWCPSPVHGCVIYSCTCSPSPSHLALNSAAAISGFCCFVCCFVNCGLWTPEYLWTVTKGFTKSSYEKQNYCPGVSLFRVHCSTGIMTSSADHRNPLSSGLAGSPPPHVAPTPLHCGSLQGWMKPWAFPVLYPEVSLAMIPVLFRWQIIDRPDQ